MFVAGRCDGDTLPIHRHVSRAMQMGVSTGLIDPIVATICGRVPFQGPFAIGHEQVTTVNSDRDNAPEAYAIHTTKLVLHRPPLAIA